MQQKLNFTSHDHLVKKDQNFLCAPGNAVQSGVGHGSKYIGRSGRNCHDNTIG